MDIDQHTNREELRADPRISEEAGHTVLIQCDSHDFIGTIENKSGGGLGLLVAEEALTHLEASKGLTLTYSMPFGLVSQRAQVRWIKAKQGGGLRLGVSFVKVDSTFQTYYQKFWEHLNEATTLEMAARSWLSLQCPMLSGVTRGIVFLGKQDSNEFEPVSYWPEGQRGCLGLTEAAELALHERRGVLKNPGQQDPGLKIPVCYFALPLLFDQQLYGVVAFEIVVRDESIMRAGMQQLQWGTSWLQLFVHREAAKKYTPEHQPLVTVLELITASLEHESFQASATSVATELASLLNCERVSVGFLNGKYIQVRALSHSVDFAKKSQLIQSLGLAMDEAMEQKSSVVYPPLDDKAVQIVRCHQKHLSEQGGGSVCTIPFCNQGVVLGALTLERPPGQVFERQTVELCETIAALIGPILETKRKEDLWLGLKVWLSVSTFFARLFGPAHSGLKLAVMLFIAVSLFCLFATGDYRIAADTKLEGSIQRVIVTPFDSYITEAHVRPGDIVKKGALLAKLDDTALLLERTKWDSQKEQYLKEYRDALGQAERSKISVLNAQLGQVDAQLAITDAQLARIQIKAPFDGVIVSGDLSQSLGAPSQRGDVLFELAPLEDYRVVLDVDERDISAVAVLQKGELVLTGLSDTLIPFTVNKITPVSETQEGRNYFRVEAELEKRLDFLRPGMEGVGKIRIGERKLIWIWSKNLLDWLRLSLWTWWPEGL